MGPSALRGQGEGVLRVTQQFLGKMDLSRMPTSSPSEYRKWMARQTRLLLAKLPVNNRPWGAARKALNLFMRDVLYNQYLDKQYKISKIASWLEVPLDSAVAKGLKHRAGRGKLPRWPGLKRLTPRVSSKFQSFADSHARTQGLERVHLDIYLWLENR